MEEQLTPSAQDFWHAWLPGNEIMFPTSPPAQVLNNHDLTIDLEGHKLHAVPVGHSDTDDTSFLWVPDLKLAVTGDIVYNGVFSYLAESLTAPLCEMWVTSIDKVKSFNPETVVVGH